MAVTATTEQSVTLDVGDVWALGILVTNEDEIPTSATVAVQVTTPSGSTSSPSATEDETGYFEASYTVAAAGRHLAVVTVSGAVVGVVPFTAWAQSPTAAAGMPTLAETKEYLGATSFADPLITNALAAESSAQRSICKVPASYPADLREALLRRVARNLAMRGLPIAVLRGDSEAGSTVLPGRDPEVRRLEAPYRKRVVG